MTNSLDACLELVSDRHRRRVVHHLRHEADGATTLEDLAEQLHSEGCDGKSGSLRDREQLAIQLHHTHLPKLAEYGVVEFELGSGAVRYQPNEQVETILDSLPTEASPPNP
ncbi:ArsR family transcriptional regulator [Haloplanus litoreus]|uniref:ArsR family transcriptional regulator n=1 Tax=Haloplanus litoreus TaxID=767515 RepID=A0ABD5ZXF1_9EURY